MRLEVQLRKAAVGKADIDGVGRLVSRLYCFISVIVKGFNILLTTQHCSTET